MPVHVPGYRLQELLGRGSQGEVWAATATRSGQPFAIKLIPTDTVAALQAARLEAALLTALAHPNLVQLHQAVSCSGALALVLERADGGSLSWLLRRRYRLSTGEVVAAVSPVAAALAYAHGEGVTHSDVSAGNILFSARGHAKLADLGVARLTAADLPATALLGTPAYCDPVVVAGGAPGPASDVFALAAVALHALTGLGPWQSSRGDTVAQVLAAAAAGEVRDLAERLAGAPAAMASVLTQALDADP
ncbi:MAG: Serine/threonine protein kinase, partial [Frankiales bacterium]|nr:Serine/threonine protein kinase [Frankiales bacterium]